MNKEQKAEVVDQIAAQLEGSTAVYAVDYRGLTVAQAAQLRGSLREAGTRFRVVKNTLTVLAAEKAGVETLKPLVEEGPTALAFVVDGDPALAAKALDTFARQFQVIALKGGLFEGEQLDIEALHRLARLPSRDQLNAQLAGIVASLLTTLVRGLGAMLSGLAIALEQVRGIKESEGPEPAAEPVGPAVVETPAEERAAEAPEAEAASEQPEEHESGDESKEPESEKEAE